MEMDRNVSGAQLRVRGEAGVRLAADTVVILTHD
jgi:hypothetical protein